MTEKEIKLLSEFGIYGIVNNRGCTSFFYLNEFIKIAPNPTYEQIIKGVWDRAKRLGMKEGANGIRQEFRNLMEDEV